MPTKLLPQRFSVRTLLACTGILAALLSLAGTRIQNVQQVTQRFRLFERLLNQDQLPAAYKMMSSRYRATNSFDEFANETRYWTQDLPMRYAHLSWGGTTAQVFESDPPWFDMYAGAVHEWTKEDRQWYFTGDSYQSLD